MSTVVNETESKKTAEKFQKQNQPVVTEVPKEMNPLEELRKQTELAYDSYITARGKVAKAYRQREQEEIRSYKQVEQQANKACDEAIQKALKIRNESEHNALQNYQDMVEKAEKIYSESVTEALRACRNTIEKQWQDTREMTGQIWDIFQGNNTQKKTD